MTNVGDNGQCTNTLPAGSMKKYKSVWISNYTTIDICLPYFHRPGFAWFHSDEWWVNRQGYWLDELRDVRMVIVKARLSGDKQALREAKTREKYVEENHHIAHNKVKQFWGLPDDW